MEQLLQEQLLQILKSFANGGDNIIASSSPVICATDNEQQNKKVEYSLLTREILKWNDTMEAQLISYGTNQVEALIHSRDDDTKDSLTTTAKDVSIKLHSILLKVMNGIYCTQSFHEQEDSVRAEKVLQQRKETTVGEQINLDPNASFEILRCSQNWLRWYLQIYMPSRQRNNDNNDDIIRQWKDSNMLELYLIWIERFQFDDRPERAKFASQILFYTTFLLSVHDEILEQAYAHMTEKIQFLFRLLVVIIQKSSIPLHLSLIRNLHNAVGSYPQHSISFVQNAQVEANNICIEKQNPWVMDAIDDNGIVTYPNALRELTLYTLKSLQQQSHDNNNNVDNRQAELVLEILRCCYALRIPGKDLVQNERWKQVVEMLLELPQENIRLHFLDCQLATLSIVMDTTAVAASECAIFINKYIPILLQIAEYQITHVMDHKYVDDRAAAALTPILVVLHKCCTANKSFCIEVKERIFTDEETFQKSVLAQSEIGQGKNMAPLHAPEGTLRWKFIQLLIWPQGLVKRLTGELLWTLCNADKIEFVHRVGMGNALPFLSMRGMAQLPPGVFS